MKAVKALFVFTFVFLALFLPVSFTAEETQDQSVLSEWDARLPSFLEIIDEEAFENTALGKTLLPDSLRTVGRRAFADINSLSYVYVPERIEWISADAFEGNDEIVFLGVTGGNAECWAEENGYRFMPAEAIMPSGGILAAKISSFAHWISMIQLLGLALTLKVAFAQKLHFRRIGEGKTMRPQERAELHAIAYRFP